MPLFLATTPGERHGDAKKRREELLRERAQAMAVRTGYPFDWQRSPHRERYTFNIKDPCAAPLAEAFEVRPSAWHCRCRLLDVLR
jgi:hypothetical protein